MLGKQTLRDQPNDDGTAETGDARKKREERARKPDVMTILSVRETKSYRSSSCIYTSSANASPVCTSGIWTGTMIA